jgi:hypothetical protein
MICANLDRLELFVGGEHFATVLPDTEGYPHLGYPPSFADFRAVDGSSRPELRIDGYLGTSKVVSRSFSADPSDDALALAADDAEIDGDGADVTRLAFRAVDRYGAPAPTWEARSASTSRDPRYWSATTRSTSPPRVPPEPSGCAPGPARGAPSPSGPATRTWATRSRVSGSAEG